MQKSTSDASYIPIHICILQSPNRNPDQMYRWIVHPNVQISLSTGGMYASKLEIWCILTRIQGVSIRTNKTDWARRLLLIGSEFRPGKTIYFTARTGRWNSVLPFPIVRFGASSNPSAEVEASKQETEEGNLDWQRTPRASKRRGQV